MFGQLGSHIDWRAVRKQWLRKSEANDQSLQTLESTYPELAKADEVWLEVLEPQLLSLERDRKRNLSLAGVLLCLFTVNAYAHFGTALFPDALPGLPFFVYFCCLGGAVWYARRAHQLSVDGHRIIAPVACSIFELSFNPVTDSEVETARRRFLRRARSGGGFFDGLFSSHRSQFPKLASVYDRLKTYQLLPSHSYAEFEDIISGRRNGRPIRSFECRLIGTEIRRGNDEGEKDRIQVHTHFMHVVQTPIDKRFRGQTLIRRAPSGDIASLRAGFQQHAADVSNSVSKNLFSILGAEPNASDDDHQAYSDMKSVRLESVSFDEQFEAMSTDQVEARYLLTPDVMSILTRLSRRYHAQELAVLFASGTATLCLQSYDKFEPAHLFTCINDESRFRRMVNDLIVVLELADSLQSTGRQAPQSEPLRNEDSRSSRASVPRSA